MHSKILHNESLSDSSFTYDYLLQWDWPEHIEMLLRRLIWARLAELSDDRKTSAQESDPSDHLAAKVCWMIAVNPNTHCAVLDVLASLNSSAFAERVAENSNACAETLMRLSDHPCHHVRCAVADNPNSPVTVITKLARDDHADVRFALAENHNLPLEILQILAEDENCYVASRANRTLQRLNPPAVSHIRFSKQQADALPMRKRASR